MKLIPIDGSSNISALAYNTEAGELRVQFKSGDTYNYSGVPPETFDAMMKSPSKGGYFHKNIKASYKWNKVEDDDKEPQS